MLLFKLKAIIASNSSSFYWSKITKCKVQVSSYFFCYPTNVTYKEVRLMTSLENASIFTKVNFGRMIFFDD